MYKRKYLGRAHSCIKTCTTQKIRVDEENFHGYAALIKIEEVHRPLFVGEKSSEICIYDNGYSELCWLPDNENWMLWALYDNHGCIIEWYFDITRINAVDEKSGEPYCDDLYLDAALLPDGKIIILDEDELIAARDNGDISQDEFDLAYRSLNRLLENKIISVEFMETLCSGLLALFK